MQGAVLGRAAFRESVTETQMLRKINEMIQWLTLGDYDVANEQATKNIVKRFTRGNIYLKNSLYLTKRATDDLSKLGDAAAARLVRKIASH
jgi:hypothetical protein